jgi:hypothetical protein
MVRLRSRIEDTQSLGQDTIWDTTRDEAWDIEAGLRGRKWTQGPAEEMVWYLAGWLPTRCGIRVENSILSGY